MCTVRHTSWLISIPELQYKAFELNTHDFASILVVVQVGDGTTTVVLLAGEFLKEAKPFIEDGVHPQNLIRSYRTASYLVEFFFPLIFLTFSLVSFIYLFFVDVLDSLD